MSATTRKSDPSVATLWWLGLLISAILLLMRSETHAAAQFAFLAMVVAIPVGVVATGDRPWASDPVAAAGGFVAGLVFHLGVVLAVLLCLLERYKPSAVEPRWSSSASAAVAPAPAIVIPSGSRSFVVWCEGLNGASGVNVEFDFHTKKAVFVHNTHTHSMVFDVTSTGFYFHQPGGPNLTLDRQTGEMSTWSRDAYRCRKEGFGATNTTTAKATTATLTNTTTATASPTTAAPATTATPIATTTPAAAPAAQAVPPPNYSFAR